MQGFQRQAAPPGRSRDDKTRHAFPKALALLHLHQMGADRRCDRACARDCSEYFDAMGQALPKPALRPFLPADVPVLAAIFAAAIEELTGDDYSEAQQEAWAGAAEDEEQFGKRLAGELTLIATMQNSPVGFASLKGADHIDMLFVHPSAARAGRRRDAVRCAGKTRRRPRRQEPHGRRQRHRGRNSSRSAATSPSSAIP